jgi:hypothetical protein
VATKLAHPESRPFAKEASKALRHYNLPGGFLDRIEREDGIEMVRVRSTAPIELKDYAAAGRWTLSLEWTIRRDPAGGSVLWRSTIGLSVRDVPFAPEKSVCLVRYDLDRERPGPGLGAIGAHLNVFQPDPIRDKLHFPVLACPGREWAVREVLDVFMAPEFVGDISRCLGQ